MFTGTINVNVSTLSKTLTKQVSVKLEDITIIQDSNSGCSSFETLKFDLPYYNLIKHVTLKVQGHEHSEAYLNDKLQLFFNSDSNYWQTFEYDQNSFKTIFKETGNYYSQIKCWKNGHGSLNGMFHVEIYLSYD